MKYTLPFLLIILASFSFSFKAFEGIDVLNESASQSISGYVWEDMNGDGIQDAYEEGLIDVSVDLYSTNDQLIESVVTDDNGEYLFENIDPGDYYLKFDASEIGDYSITIPNISDNEDEDSDVDNSNGEGTTAVFNLSLDQNIDNIDAGYYQFSTVGDFVWEDLNGNGIQDQGEPGISEVVVELTNVSDNVVFIDTTDDNGHYFFDLTYEITPGEYILKFNTPDGYFIIDRDMGNNDKKDSDANTATGKTYFFGIESGDIQNNWDAGMYVPPTIGDYIWHDENEDGIQDYDEKPMANIDVKLYRDFDNALIDIETSDWDGYYQFKGYKKAKPGDYYIVFEELSDYYFTKQYAGASDVDSDPLESGITSVFTVYSGLDTSEIDAGYYLKYPNCENIGAGSCDEANVYCELYQLNDKCFVMPYENQQTIIPGCVGNFVFNNPSWFAFEAGAEDVAIMIHFVECENGSGSRGLQWGVYDDCDMENPIALQCTCVPPGDQLIDLEQLIIGHAYYLFIDGCSGSRCKYWIEVLEGGELVEVEGPDTISCSLDTIGCDTVCVNSPLLLEFKNIFYAEQYIWKINGKADTTGKQDTIVYFFEPGNFKICGYGISDCDIGEQKCIDVFVENCCLKTDSIVVNTIYNDYCNDDCLAKIEVSKVKGAIPPLKYRWGTKDTTNFIDSLCSGIYYLTVTDSSYCSFIDSFEVSIHEKMHIVYSTVNESCNSCDGEILIQSISNSIGTLSYIWNTGDTTSQINNLCNGTYTVTVTDSLACQVIDTISIETSADLVIKSSQIDASCYGECDGIISIQNVENSTEPLKYNWNTGGSQSLINNLCSGEYTVTIIDSLGCTVTDTFFIEQPPEIHITVDSIVDITDSGLGGIYISTNDNGKYEFEWTGTNGYSGDKRDLIDIDTADCYTLVVTDTLTNCTMDTTICITDNTSLFDQGFSTRVFNIYPNPNTGKFIIDFHSKTLAKVELEIFDVQGHIVKKEKMNKSNKPMQINLKNINTGIYFIKLKYEEGVLIRKILVEK